MNFRQFLERISDRRLPMYGTLIWDGKSSEFAIAVNFELNRSEPAEVVCQRAERYLGELTPGEWESFNIEVTIRDGKPVRAVLKPLRSGVITTARLRQLEAVLRE